MRTCINNFEEITCYSYSLRILIEELTQKKILLLRCFSFKAHYIINNIDFDYRLDESELISSQTQMKDKLSKRNN